MEPPIQWLWDEGKLGWSPSPSWGGDRGGGTFENGTKKPAFPA